MNSPWAPLAGVRVVDFGWIVAAPYAGFLLAALGAEVIKVESKQRCDPLRLRFAIRNKVIDWDTADISSTFHAVNRGKCGLAVNIKSPEGLALIKSLIRTSVILLENYTVGTLERFGLDDNILATLNPRLIRVSFTAAGRVGSLAGLRGYAATTSSLAGLEGSVGYPDDENPIGMLNYGLADYTAGTHGAFAALREIARGEAREYRSIDAAQLAANVDMLGAGFARFGANLPPIAGNQHLFRSPHGIYPCGDGGYVALVVSSDCDWQRFAMVSGIDEPELAYCATRLDQRQRVDQLVKFWTLTLNRDEVVTVLQRAEIEAAPVLSLPERHEHPIFVERGSSVAVTLNNGTAINLPRQPWIVNGRAQSPVASLRAPNLGEHSEYICRKILGLSELDFDQLVRGGVVDTPQSLRNVG